MIKKHGLYVVADVANLPFKPDAFDAAISMHTIHHLPMGEHKHAYLELERVLKPERSAAVVNGWHEPRLMKMVEPLIRIGRFINGRSTKKKKDWSQESQQDGTFVEKMTPKWLRKELGGAVSFEIHPWRSLSPRFMRWFIRPRLGGRFFLRIIYWLEEKLPRFFGENGQYPLIVIRKPRA